MGGGKLPAMSQLKKLATDIFHATLAKCNIAAAFQQQVRRAGNELYIRDLRYDLSDFRSIVTVSLGKAAHTMAVAFQHALGTDLDGIVVTPHAISDPVRLCRYVVGGHPLPTGGSFHAGVQVAQLLRSCGASDLVVFLISGGGSALVESPLPPVSPDELVNTYRALLHSGASISEMNVVRKHLSAVKGGRMAQLA